MNGLVPPAELSFLLGSGISIPAGFPSVAELTTTVLTATNVYQHTDQRYFFSDDPQPLHHDTREAVERVQGFLDILRQIAQGYYRGDDSPSPRINYEDLGAMTAQIDWSETGEWDNPALGPLISTLLRTYGDDLTHLATEATRYIRDVVAASLHHDCSRYEHLGLLTDAARDAAFGRCTIFTLNHDILIETALRASGIAYTDGTSQIGLDCWRWCAETLESQPAGTRFYKLHGSIDWHRAIDVRGRSSVIIAKDADHARTHDGSRLRRINGPLILVGTHAKVLNYIQGIFADLYYAFRGHLRHHARVVVVCGYGFRDKFINAVLLEWLDADRSRLVVIHGNPNQLRRDARPAIAREWDRLVDAGKLHVVSAWAEDVSWFNIRPLVVAA